MEQSTYYWYILYTRTNAEQRVIKDITEAYNKRAFDYSFEPFCPESEFYYRQKAAAQKDKIYRKRPLFPCYVFIETEMPPELFLKTFSTYIYNSPDIIRILRYGGSDNIALDENERKRFEYLFKGKRCFDHSVGYIEGDKIVVTTGPLMGHEGLIKKINRHNCMAIIKLDMFGGEIDAKVALEIVDKT